MYLEVPRLTGRDEDQNWVRGNATGRYFLSQRGVADMRAKIRDERKASWEPLFLWAAAASGWVALLLKTFLPSQVIDTACRNQHGGRRSSGPG